MRDYPKEARVLSEKFKKDMVGTWDQAMQFLLDYDAEIGELGIVDEDYINEIVEDEAKKWGWQRVACFLNGITNAMHEDFYRIDGYGNAQVISASTIEMWLDDIAGY